MATLCPPFVLLLSLSTACELCALLLASFRPLSCWRPLCPKQQFQKRWLAMIAVAALWVFCSALSEACPRFVRRCCGPCVLVRLCPGLLCGAALSSLVRVRLSTLSAFRHRVVQALSRAWPRRPPLPCPVCFRVAMNAAGVHHF